MQLEQVFRRGLGEQPEQEQHPGEDPLPEQPGHRRGRRGRQGPPEEQDREAICDQRNATDFQKLCNLA